MSKQILNMQSKDIGRVRQDIFMFNQEYPRESVKQVKLSQNTKKKSSSRTGTAALGYSAQNQPLQIDLRKEKRASKYENQNHQQQQLQQQQQQFISNLVLSTGNNYLPYRDIQNFEFQNHKSMSNVVPEQQSNLLHPQYFYNNDYEPSGVPGAEDIGEWQGKASRNSVNESIANQQYEGQIEGEGDDETSDNHYQGFNNNDNNNRQKYEDNNLNVVTKINNFAISYQENTVSEADEQSGAIVLSNDEEWLNKRGILTLRGLLRLPRNIRKDQKLVFDASSTHYPIVKAVCQNTFNFTTLLARPSNRNEWNLKWYDTYVSQEDLRGLQPYQKINHFPGSSQLGQKNLLAISLLQMKEACAEGDFDFFPATWLLPFQREEMNNFVKNRKSEQIFLISKPQAACQGRGIFLTNNLGDFIPGQRYVVQEYIQNPFLIEDLKFDFRIYVLIQSIDPLKIFIYREGLARLATEKYEKPNQSNQECLMMHLTNYAINKKSEKFQYNQSQDMDHVGHKRSYSSILKILDQMGYNIQTLEKEINDIIVQTIISVVPNLSYIYQNCQPSRQNNELCFQLLGFDIMLDQNLKPWLIEVNHSPSFHTDSPLDLGVKQNLITDTLILENINSRSKTDHFQQQFCPTNFYNKIENQKSLAEIKEHENRVSAFQEENLGGFLRIYPTPETERLTQILETSNRIWRDFISQAHVVQQSRGLKTGDFLEKRIIAKMFGDSSMKPGEVIYQKLIENVVQNLMPAQMKEQGNNQFFGSFNQPDINSLSSNLIGAQTLTNFNHQPPPTITTKFRSNSQKLTSNNPVKERYSDMTGSDNILSSSTKFGDLNSPSKSMNSYKPNQYDEINIQNPGPEVKSNQSNNMKKVHKKNFSSGTDINPPKSQAEYSRAQPNVPQSTGEAPMKAKENQNSQHAEQIPSDNNERNIKKNFEENVNFVVENFEDLDNSALIHHYFKNQTLSPMSIKKNSAWYQKFLQLKYQYELQNWNHAKLQNERSNGQLIASIQENKRRKISQNENPQAAKAITYDLNAKQFFNFNGGYFVKKSNQPPSQSNNASNQNTYLNQSQNQLNSDYLCNPNNTREQKHVPICVPQEKSNQNAFQKAKNEQQSRNEFGLNQLSKNPSLFQQKSEKSDENQPKIGYSDEKKNQQQNINKFFNDNKKILSNQLTMNFLKTVSGVTVTSSVNKKVPVSPIFGNPEIFSLIEKQRFQDNPHIINYVHQSQQLQPTTSTQAQQHQINIPAEKIKKQNNIPDMMELIPDLQNRREVLKLSTLDVENDVYALFQRNHLLSSDSPNQQYNKDDFDLKYEFKSRQQSPQSKIKLKTIEDENFFEEGQEQKQKIIKFMKKKNLIQLNNL